MGLLARIFGYGAKQDDRRQQRLDDQLSMAEPMAAVGAELAVEGNESETEKALKRSANVSSDGRDG